MYTNSQLEQGRIHGHQLRTGAQGRKCAFSHFSTRAHQRTNQRTDGRTDKGSYRVACPQLKRRKIKKKREKKEVKKEKKKRGER